MKITEVKLHVIRHEPPHVGPLELGILRLIGEDGLEGNAFVGSHFHTGRPLFDPILSVLKPRLLGRDVAEREWLWSNVWTRTGLLAHKTKMPTAAWAAVDVAMWDLAGKAARMPIYQILGAQRDRMPTYASPPGYAGVEKTIDACVEEARECAARGFPGFKMHCGHGPCVVERAQETAQRVREAVGDHTVLMMDGAQGLDYTEALHIGLVLDEYRFCWFEDPIRHTDVNALVELSRRLRTRLAMTDNNDFRFFDALLYVQRGAARILRSDCAKLGITGLKKLVSLCEAFGLDCEFHHGANALMNAANLHVSLSASNCEFYEWMVPDDEVRFGLVDGMKVDGKGWVHAPQAPGLGFDLDWNMLNKLTFQVL